MLVTPEQAAPANRRARHTEESDLCSRVRAEFREMPGLTLTVRQAARLFDIDPDRCERVLGALVREGHLATNGKAFANPSV